jgi:hypothetical protein
MFIVYLSVKQNSLCEVTTKITTYMGQPILDAKTADFVAMGLCCCGLDAWVVIEPDEEK